MPKVRLVLSYGFCSKFHTLLAVQNFENRLRLDKVAESLKVGTFLRHSVVQLLISAVKRGRRFSKSWVILRLNCRLKGYCSRQYLWTIRHRNGCTTTLPLEVFTQRNFAAEYSIKVDFYSTSRSSAGATELEPPPQIQL